MSSGSAIDLYLYRLYEKKGQQEKWLAAIKALEQAIGDRMPLAQRHFYSIRRARRLQQVERFEEAISTLARFVEWAEQTPQQHPLKWYYVMEIQNSLATIYREMDNLPAARQTLAQTEQRLEPYRAERQTFLETTTEESQEIRQQVEEIYQRMMEYNGSAQVVYEAPLIGAPLVELHAFIDRQYRRGIDWSTFNLAIGYLQLDEGETALRLFQTYRDYRIENGITRGRGNFHMWLAGLMLSVRQDREAALDHLRQAAQDSDFVARGQLKKRFFNGGFDSVVEDEDFLAVVNTSVLHE
jgi:tetratricopeptide (TPR) repeat protein